MDITTIKFKMDGPKLKESIPLREVIIALTEFQHIVDKSYLCATKSKRLYDRDRKNYDIIATDFRKGSLSAEFQILTASVVQALPNIPFDAYKNIWEIAKGSYDLLKAIAVKRSSGVEPVINITGNVNAPIIIGNNININETVFNAADRNEPHFKKMTAIIDPKQIDYIESFDGSGMGFKLTESDRNLFHPKTKLDREILPIECDIYKYDKDSRIGKLRVFEGQVIPARDYTFKPILADSGYRFIHAMTKMSIKLDIMREIEVHTTGLERVSALHVVNIHDEFSQPSLFDSPLQKQTHIS